MSLGRKSRAEKRIDLPEPIPIIYKESYFEEQYISAKLIALTWRKRDHPDVILRLKDGSIQKIDYYRVYSNVFLDQGDGLEVFKEIVKLRKERDEAAKVFNEKIDELLRRVPNLNAPKIIEEYEDKLGKGAGA